MRIVIAEDSLLLREGLVALLRQCGHDVVAAVGTAEELIAAVDAQPPDLVITDVRMPPDHGDEGLRAALDIRRRHGEMPILVLSQYVGLTYAAELVERHSSAIGYLLKDRIADVTDFVDAVARIAAGGVVIDPEVVRRLLARQRKTTALTARELQVLRRVAAGRTNAAIARDLRVSDVAIAKHIGAVFDKLGLAPTADDNRRVLAVLHYLNETPGAGPVRRSHGGSSPAPGADGR
ncbi:response regulator transcription factor [Fodinicola acaciae]|uniref:response regulator transcription factor n=1 Tax=Fodinicola acaciae TaxID=2681555 RepID=UPI0013D3760C|nr:response regulator transcription factor [Fodinicola acaciae]